MLSSKATAAEQGASGKKHDPRANRPFFGITLKEYIEHWEIGRAHV